MKLFLQIVTSMRCNLRCTYCYETLDGRTNSVEDIISFQTAYLIPKLETGKYDGIVIDYIGGEPFLHPDMLLKSMDHITQLKEKYNLCKTEFVICTNGTRFNDERCLSILKKYKNELTLNVSLDGIKEKHDSQRIDKNGNGSFDKCLEGLEIAKTILDPKKIIIKSTFNKESINLYSRSIKYLSTLGIGKISANMVFEDTYNHQDGINMSFQLIDSVNYLLKTKPEVKIDFLDESLDSFYKQTKPKTKINLTSNKCGAGLNKMSLGVNGKIYGCNRFMSNLENESIIAKLNNGKINLTDNPITSCITNNYKSYPNDCQECQLLDKCSQCLALPIENGARSLSEMSKYYDMKQQCYWTKAKEIARLYFAMRLASNN